jgi:hypothetical protein
VVFAFSRQCLQKVDVVFLTNHKGGLCDMHSANDGDTSK